MLRRSVCGGRSRDRRCRACDEFRQPVGDIELASESPSQKCVILGGSLLSYLLARAAGQGALELHEGAADLVTDACVALLVVDNLAPAEEAAAARRGRGRGVVVVRHVGLCVCSV